MRHLTALAGSFLLLALWAAPAAAQAVPTVQIVQTSTHPTPPPGWKVACMPNATNGGASPTCPVLQYNGYTYWAWSDDQNAVAMAIVAYDSNGVAVKQWNRNGARYIWNLTVDPVAETAAFIGQANAQIVLSWNDLFIPTGSGELTFVNVAAPGINCVFNTPCTVTVNDSIGAIALPPGVSGTGSLQTRTFAGAAGSPGAGLTAYEYRVDMTQAVSDGEASCVTDVAVDFGTVSRLSYDGTGQIYDAYVITQGGIGSVGLFNISKTGSVVDFVFDQPVCAGHSPGTGLSSYFFGIASKFAPKSVTANVGWPGLSGIGTAARAPNHP
ncbi:MAG TPA: hypothetical protein VII56_05820 [Rhizomicrobium sp.]